MDKLHWCFSIRNGLRMVEPNENLSKSYLNEAEKAISKVKDHIEDDDLVWASVRIYYSAYYSIYSLLQKIGVKSENHDCSIELAKNLINEEFMKNIDEFKTKRIDSQYYLKTGKKEEILKLYNLSKDFYLKLKDIISNMTDEEAIRLRKKIENDLRKKS